MVYYNESANEFTGWDGSAWQVFGASGVGGPTDAQYVVLAASGSLSAERVLTGTANQITVTDGGANGNVTLALPQDMHTGATPGFAGGTLTGALTFSGVTTDITTGTNEHLALMPNGTGGVGIGTTVPAANLHVYSSGDTAVQFTDGDALNARIQYDAGSNGLEFFTGGTADSNRKMFISDSSNAFVGIGVNLTTPTGTEYLKVSGGPDIDTWIQVAGSDGTTADAIRTILGMNGGGAYDRGFVGTATNHNFAIRTNNFDRFVVTAAGSVDLQADATTLRIPRKAAAGDPAGTNGMLYYNSSSGKFRAYEGATWKDLVVAAITSLGGLTASTQTFTNDTNVTISSSGTTHTLGWSGTLAVSRGGTAASSLGTNAVLVTNSAGNAVTAVTGTTGQVLKHNGTTWAAGSDAVDLWTAATDTYLTDTTDNVAIGTSSPISESSRLGLTVWGPGTNGAGGRVYFGDRGAAGTNPWIGESGTTDTNQLELSGRSGIVMAGKLIPKWVGGSTFSYGGVTYTIQSQYTWSENSHLYLRVTSASAQTWAQHAAAARSIGGYLVTITSSAEQTAIWNNLGGLTGQAHWIGATDVLDEAGTNGDKFEWVTGEIGADGTNSIYGNWASGEPNDWNGVEDAAELRTDGLWNDGDVAATKTGFIVEISYMTPGR
jgi:hypothetical protein